MVPVAAICPPLDLTRAIEDIDAPVRWPYRQHVLRALKAMVVPIAARRELPLPLAKARAIILVSHGLAVVQEMATRVLWLDHGKKMQIGEPEEVVKAYTDFVNAGTSAMVMDEQ